MAPKGELALDYYEFEVDPVELHWHQEMIDNPDAKYCFVFDARNIFRELTENGNRLMQDLIEQAVDVYCNEQSVDTWYYPSVGTDEHCHLLYTSTSSWIVALRMSKGTEPNLYNVLMRRLDHVEVRK
jgi:hypothetical protein